MFKRLRKKFTRYITRIELRDLIWFDCEGAFVEEVDFKQGKKYITFPDGLRIILENGKYVNFYTQQPYV